MTHGRHCGLGSFSENKKAAINNHPLIAMGSVFHSEELITSLQQPFAITILGYLGLSVWQLSPDSSECQEQNSPFPGNTMSLLTGDSKGIKNHRQQRAAAVFALRKLGSADARIGGR